MMTDDNDADPASDPAKDDPPNEPDPLVEIDEENDEPEAEDALPDSRPAFRSDAPRGALEKLALPAGAALAAGGLVWLLYSGRVLLPFLTIATGAGLAAGGLLAQRRASTPIAPYQQPELNRTPGSISTTTVARRGDVKTGRTDVREPNGTTRPYISIWIVPSANNLCGASGAYRWYQFVRIRFFINNRQKQLRRGILGATGLTYPFNQWTPDYHQGDPGTVGPDLRPPGLNLPAGTAGKPFKPYGIGGQLTGGGTSLRTGIIDAPDFCNRGRNALSPIERLYRRFVSVREVERRRQPPEARRTVKIEVEARSYLVCVKDGQADCIGYVGWTYTNEADLRLVWNASGTTLGTNRRWVLGSEIFQCRHSLTIAGWTAGC
jgi:hypothetical protein